MNIEVISAAVAKLTNDIQTENFIYDLLAAYGKPKASITRLKKGNFNLSKAPDEVIWKRNVLFKAVNSKIKTSKKTYVHGVTESTEGNQDLHALIDTLRKSEVVSKHALRFVITTNWTTLLAVDTKTGETLDIAILDLHKHVHFFLPWAGMEKHSAQNESLADIKAAYKMAKLYDQICEDNPDLLNTNPHLLNVFLSRLLFCFFAEDTEIFPRKGMFTSAIASHTNEDGTDLDTYLDKLFDVMNTEKRLNCPAFLDEFPFVNGGLLRERIAAPKFSKQSRKLIIECGDLDWSEINPDIFGSMMQAVVHLDKRSETGMHYTSVTNIMKVIEPLFLSELRSCYEQNKDNPKALERLRSRLSKIKLFDPACGSGNFLIIAFKELRKLEMDIYQRLRELDPNYQAYFTLPKIQLTQFFGIEIDDFAHEIAILSMWLAEHQMNIRFKENLGIVVPHLPLKPSGHIVCGNATVLDWNNVCLNDQNTEIYVLGNPPYCGSTYQTNQQKADMNRVFYGIRNYKSLDYISCWFLKAADYVKDAENASFAFVSTNSICQGEQVELLWPHILERGLEIIFAHRSFKWQNNAKNNAGVTVVVIGIRKESSIPKLLFTGKNIKTAINIGPYLSPGRNIIVKKESKPISNLPKLTYGNKPVDGGNLILSKVDKDKLLTEFPESSRFIKKLMGSDEFINAKQRWCLWISDADMKLAMSIPPIANRIEKVKRTRLASRAKDANLLASRPHQFRDTFSTKNLSVIVPSVSSEKREYIPIGFLSEDTIITNLAFAVYEPEPWLFAILASKMHNVWVRAVGGRLEERIRYSSGLCYNTFPFPEITEKQKETLSVHAFNVLSERENHPEKTIAQLYDPETMPIGLLTAHKDLDLAIERCYRSKPFQSDEDRTEYLFGLYETIKEPNAEKGAVYA